jgi:flagellar biosynthesis/type III secretory pathway protein FliH
MRVRTFELPSAQDTVRSPSWLGSRARTVVPVFGGAPAVLATPGRAGDLFDGQQAELGIGAHAHPEMHGASMHDPGAPAAGDVAQAAAPAAQVDPAVLIEQEVERRIREIAGRAMDEGRAHGEQVGMQVYQAAAERLEAAARDLICAREQILAGLEKQLLELSVVCAEAIVGREISSEDGYCARVVREALALSGEADETEIRVSSQDHAELAPLLSTLSEENPRAGTLRVIADERISAGCLVETKLARVDGTVAGRLQSVLEAVTAGSEA